MTADAEPLGLYLHIPFCEAKCTYGHFAIDPRRPDAQRQERYVRALLRELSGAGDGLVADTLYFGTRSFRPSFSGLRQEDVRRPELRGQAA